MKRKVSLAVLILFISISALTANDTYVNKFCSGINLDDTLTYPVKTFGKMGHQKSPRPEYDYVPVTRIASITKRGSESFKGVWCYIDFDFSDLPFISQSDPASRRDVKIALIAQSSMRAAGGSLALPFSDFILSGVGWNYVQDNGIFGNGENYLVLDTSEVNNSIQIKFANKVRLSKRPDYWIDVVLMLPPVTGDNLAITDDYESTLRFNVNGGPMQDITFRGFYKKPMESIAQVYLDVNPLTGSHMNLKNLNAGTLNPVADISVEGEYFNTDGDNDPELDLYIGSEPWHENITSSTFLMTRSGDNVFVPLNSFDYELKLEKTSGKPFSVMEPGNPDALSTNQSSLVLDGSYKNYIRLNYEKTKQRLDFGWEKYIKWEYQNQFKLSMKVDASTVNAIHNESNPMMPGIYSSDVYLYLVSNR